MLAKSWKKIALAICIVAILFNVTHKLIARTSLKEELRSVLGGNAISFSTEDNTVSSENKTKSEKNENTSKEDSDDETSIDIEKPSEESQEYSGEEQENADEYSEEAQENSEETAENSDFSETDENGEAYETQPIVVEEEN